MESEWRDLTLGEMIRLQRGHDLTDPQRTVGEIPVFGSAGLNGYHGVSRVKGPGVVIGRSGASFGKVHFSSRDYWPHNTALYVTDFLGNDELFTFHFLQTIDFSSFNSGSAQPSLNRNHIYLMPVRIPPLAEQRAIAHILGSLDDKIELNRRMNETLEGMAQALFKSWFVDFDPVIDNALVAGNPIPDELADRAEVRRAALADGTANREAAKHFPAAFQQTEELGWIPVGWEVRKMSDHCEIVMGHSPKGDTYNTDGVGTPLVNGPVEFGPYFTRRTKWTTAPTRLSVRGDLVVCVRGSTTGRFVKSDGEYCLGRGVCSIRGIHSQCFVDQLFRSNVTALLGLTTGSTFPNWSRPSLTEFKTISPPVSIVRAFDAYVAPCVIRIESGFVESESLTKLRDTLLSKLISGELRIPDAEKLAEASLA